MKRLNFDTYRADLIARLVLLKVLTAEQADFPENRAKAIALRSALPKLGYHQAPPMEDHLLKAYWEAVTDGQTEEMLLEALRKIQRVDFRFADIFERLMEVGYTRQEMDLDGDLGKAMMRVAALYADRGLEVPLNADVVVDLVCSAQPALSDEALIQMLELDQQ